MKNYFIANRKVLNINMSIEGIESWAQGSLDEYTSGMAQFTVKEISEKKVRMFSVRDFDYDPDVSIIFDADMALINGVGIGAFQSQQVGGHPMIYPLSSAGKNLYTGIIGFIRFYKLQLFEETRQIVEHIGLRYYSDRILMQVIF